MLLELVQLKESLPNLKIEWIKQEIQIFNIGSKVAGAGEKCKYFTNKISPDKFKLGIS